MKKIVSINKSQLSWHISPDYISLSLSQSRPPITIISPTSPPPFQPSVSLCLSIMHVPLLHPPHTLLHHHRQLLSLLEVLSTTTLSIFHHTTFATTIIATPPSAATTTTTTTIITISPPTQLYNMTSINKLKENNKNNLSYNTHLILYQNNYFSS